jgi:hypothetical protein
VKTFINSNHVSVTRSERLAKSKAKRLIGLAVTAAATALVSAHPAAAGTSYNAISSTPVQQGQTSGVNNPAITISFSGQTALRAFNTSAAISELTPGTTIVLHDGAGGAPIEYIAPNNSNTYVQLASPAFNSADVGAGTPGSPSTALLQQASAIRLEWHEQGSAEGLVDLINDEVGYAGGYSGTPLSDPSLRGPTSANPTWINTNKFVGTGSTEINGFVLNGAVSDPANTYDPTLYNLATGVNLQQGQNRIQFSVGEYKTEDLSVSGGTASLNATPGSAGYGKGNPALPSSSTSGLGAVSGRQAFVDSSSADEGTSIIDPQSTTSQTYGQEYGSGPWNTAGANNITSTPIAVTAVGISANPGTGLQRLDLTDTQWLQTTGRLQNGAGFNFVSRDINAGQRTVFALNTGVDPSWAVGVDDGGNSTGTLATGQHSIGSQLRFSGKTSGSEAEATISQSRFSLGVLSLSDDTSAKANAPVRSLPIDFYDAAGSSGASNDSNYIGINFNTTVDYNSAEQAPAYKAILISNYNTIKTPNPTALANEEAANPSLTAAQAWAQLNTFDATNPSDNTTSGIKGDVYGDVASFISNIANSIGSAAAGLTTGSLTNADNPADGLFANGYLIPGLVNWQQTVAGQAATSVTLNSSQLAEQSAVNSNYGYLFTTDNNVNPYGASTETIGSGAEYASLDTQSTLNGTIAITAKNSSGTLESDGNIEPAGNYLVGNFNQNGVRDYSSVQQAVNALLSLYNVDRQTSNGVDSIFTANGGVTNSTVIPSLGIGSLSGTPGWVTTNTDTKGDLITMGDINGDGAFNGKDLYLLASEAALASGTGSVTTLSATYSTFSDVVRSPNSILRKNDALNWINSYLSPIASGTATTGAGPAIDAQWIYKTARATVNVGTTSLIPAYATNLGANPGGGYDYTFDVNGLNAFNPVDVARDGLVNANDALIVDKFAGDDKTNLNESLAATINQDGTTDPSASEQVAINLWQVGQIDGAANDVIGQADVNVVDTALTGPAEEYWTGSELKSGPTDIEVDHSAGTNNLPGVPAVTVNTGASLTIQSGTFGAGGAVDIFTDSNSGAHLPVTNNANFDVTGGSQHPQYILGTGTTNVSGGTLTVNNITQGTINVSAGTLAIAGVGSLGSGSVSSLNISGNGVLDVGSSGLVIEYGSGTSPVGDLSFAQSARNYPANSIQHYAQTGFNGLNWNGTGIVSSYAANDPSGLTAVGVADENDLDNVYPADYTVGGGGRGTWLGQAINDPNNVLVRLTYYGDGNLDGVVNKFDVAALAQGYSGLAGYIGWSDGDYTYAGYISKLDISLLAQSYVFQGAPLGDAITAGQAQYLLALDPDLSASSAAFFQAVAAGETPEPTSLAALIAPFVGLLARRRRLMRID